MASEKLNWQNIKATQEKQDAIKDEKIKNLLGQKGSSQEELLTEKLNSRKRNLDLISSRLGINSEQIHNLSKCHEKLFVARKTQNQTNVDLYEVSIVRIKQEFSGQGIDMIDIQEILEKCEKIAELS